MSMIERFLVFLVIVLVVIFIGVTGARDGQRIAQIKALQAQATVDSLLLEEYRRVRDMLVGELERCEDLYGPTGPARFNGEQ